MIGSKSGLHSIPDFKLMIEINPKDYRLKIARIYSQINLPKGYYQKCFFLTFSQHRGFIVCQAGSTCPLRFSHLIVNHDDN